jgi:hypothetical protein
MKNLPPYSSDPRLMNVHAVRRQQQPAVPAWKKPRVWFRIIMVTFSFNLFIAVVTIERHISFSTLASSSSTFEIDRPKIKISPMSYRWRLEQPKAQFLTESRIWHRMLLQQQEQEKERTNNHVFCNNTNGKNQTTATSTKSSGVNHQGLVDDSNGVNKLSPFGFPETVRAYVQEHENKNKNESSLKGLSMSSSSSSTYCLAPPSEPSCQSFQYTVVIYSSGNNNRNDGEVVRKDYNSSTAFDYPRPNNADSYWRNIVVGAMKFLAYPSVQRVNLVLREETTTHNNNIEVGSSANRSAKATRRRTALEVSAKRNKYAKRVLNWSRKGVVNVVSTSSFWDAIERLEVPSESMLWIDGDHRFGSQNNNIAANGTVLKHQFLAWREVPNALMIPKEISIVPVSLSKINGHNDKNNARGSVCSTVPLLHEMMMHRNYLCYLNHPVVGSELRNYTDSVRRRVKANDNTRNGDYDDTSSSWDVTTMAMGMLLFSIGDGYVIEDAADHSSVVTAAAAAYKPLLPFHSTAEGDNDTLAATHAEEISNYFGCPCSMAIPRLSPSNTRQCTRYEAAPE